MQPNLIRLEQLYKSKKAINLNNKLIKKILGFEDMRDFFEEVYTWGHQKDFTYQTEIYDSQKFIRSFIKDWYLER